MNSIRLGTLRQLANATSEPCVSLLMPTDRAPHESLRSPVLFRQLIDRSGELLQERGLRRSEAEELLDPATQLLHDDQFWRAQQDGLAMYLNSEFSQIVQLPEAVHEQVIVGAEFEIVPLLPFVQEHGEYYLLMLTQHTARLLRGDRLQLEEIPLDGMPEALRQALEALRGERLNPHTEAARPRDRSGERAPVLQGRRAAPADENLEASLRRLDESLAAFLRADSAPLVFAGEPEMFDLYRRLATCENLVGQPITGSFARISDEELLTRAFELAEPHLDGPHRFEMNDFLSARSTGRGSDQVDQILTAAVQGLVDCLFLPAGGELWGTIEQHDGAVSVIGSFSATDRDVANFATVHVLRNRGHVRFDDFRKLPDTPMAAILRAPVSAIAGTAVQA